MRHGFLLVDKPFGPTSHDAVGTVRKILHERSIGHLGTLDPAATGLLVLAVGKKALKVIELFSSLRKTYEAEVTFGSISSTYDQEGVIEELPRKAGWEIPDLPTVRNVITDRFVGKIMQVPPVHSAVHVDGQRAYQRAMRGENVVLGGRQVEIDAIDILSYEFPKITLNVSCGSGTYIRSLANDLGAMLRCGGYLSALRRTSIDVWDVKNAKDPEKVDWTDVIPLKDLLDRFPRVDLTADEWDDINHGRVIERDAKEHAFGWYDELPVVLLKSMGEGIARARKVL